MFFNRTFGTLAEGKDYAINSKAFPLSLARREALWAYAFITPWIIGFLIFTVGPMLASLFFSFTEYDIVTPPRWIGLTNYINLIS